MSDGSDDTHEIRQIGGEFGVPVIDREVPTVTAGPAAVLVGLGLGGGVVAFRRFSRGWSRSETL
ncbi:hypothetical protein [Nonomuraea candida]|uniref:hypothetical protein n=1 Tax=Nonomuraea candida TaxID=359159 RepID=UPI0005BC6A57|nr:hypothetical protein [Nonomuraea candida]